MMAFEQGTIKIEREKEFEELKGAITRACASENVVSFLKAVQSAKLRIRDVEGVIAKGILEQVGPADSGRTPPALYQGLTVSDQAQLREFYLFKVEEIDPKLRAKFHKLYQYY